VTQDSAFGAVRTSSIERLVADLRGADPVRREAAIARLRLAGARAIGRLTNLLQSDGDAAVRAAALKALDGIPDRRAIEPALAALRDDEAEVAIAAAGVLRGWVADDDSTRVLEALRALTLDRERPSAVRLAALDALAELPRHLVQPLREHLPPRTGPESTGPQADDAEAVRSWVDAHGATAALSELHAAVVQARDGERAEPAPGGHLWLLARGAAHAALARRGSRVALYDLREAFDGAQAPLPLDFLTAMTVVGDSSCLEPMARAWAAAPGETWWRDRLKDAAGDILRRDRLTARNPIVKRVRSKWPEFL
jgi:hypothetical protein